MRLPKTVVALRGGLPHQHYHRRSRHRRPNLPPPPPPPLPPSRIPVKMELKMMKMEKMAKCLWWCSPYWHFKGTHFRYGILVKPRFESGQMSIFSANRGSSFLPTRKKMLKRKKRKRTRSSLLLLLVCVRQDRHRLVFASSGCQPISSLICYLYIL